GASACNSVRQPESGTSTRKTPSSNSMGRVRSATAVPQARGHASIGACSGGVRRSASLTIFCRPAAARSMGLLQFFREKDFTRGLSVKERFYWFEPGATPNDCLICFPRTLLTGEILVGHTASRPRDHSDGLRVASLQPLTRFL